MCHCITLGQKLGDGFQPWISKALNFFRMKIMGVNTAGLTRDLSGKKACDCDLTKYCSSWQCPGLSSEVSSSPCNADFAATVQACFTFRHTFLFISI